MKLNNRKIAVLGAGVAGLATARALALLGARPIVVEQAPDLIEIGAGLQITPNGMAVLDALGLGTRARDAGLPLDDVSLHDHRKGASVLRLGLSKNPSAGNWLAIPRTDLIRIMREGVERVGAEVRTGARVVRIETRPQKTILNTADGRTIEAAIVIAADGLHSLGRQTLGGAATPFFTGQVAWRALIRDDGDAPAVAQVFMAPGRHLVSYPLPGGRRNIVAVDEREDWAEESWTASGDPDQMRRAFNHFGGPVPGWLAKVDKAHLWGLFRHEVPARWHGGSLVLVGDAAHPTLPFLAQGANLALEDAWVLADTLADAPGVSAALTTFQERRVERVKRAIRAANANARNYHLRNPLLRFAAHNGLRLGSLFSPRAALGRFDWLYRHDVTAAAADKPQHVSVPEVPPLAVAGAPEEPKRTPKPVIPRAKPAVGSRLKTSRITFGRTAGAEGAAQGAEAAKPAPPEPAPPRPEPQRPLTLTTPVPPLAARPAPEAEKPAFPKAPKSAAPRPDGIIGAPIARESGPAHSVKPVTAPPARHPTDDPDKSGQPAGSATAGSGPAMPKAQVPPNSPPPAKAAPAPKAPPPRMRPYGDDTAASPRRAAGSTAPKRADVADAARPAARPTAATTARVKPAAGKAPPVAKAEPAGKPRAAKAPAAGIADAKTAPSAEPATKTAQAKKPAVKKPAAKKPAENKAAAKKSPAKKTTAKTTKAKPAKKSPAKKPAAKATGNAADAANKPGKKVAKKKTPKPDDKPA